MTIWLALDHVDNVEMTALNVTMIKNALFVRLGFKVILENANNVKVTVMHVTQHIVWTALQSIAHLVMVLVVLVQLFALNALVPRIKNALNAILDIISQDWTGNASSATKQALLALVRMQMTVQIVQLDTAWTKANAQNVKACVKHVKITENEHHARTVSI